MFRVDISESSRATARKYSYAMTSFLLPKKKKKKNESGALEHKRCPSQYALIQSRQMEVNNVNLLISQLKS